MTDTIPDKLAIAYEKEGNYTAAAGELQLIAANYKSDDPELSRQALWKAAEMQDRAEQPQASIALYQQYLQEWPQPYDLPEAQFRLVELNRKTGNSERETYWLQQLVTSYRKPVTRPTTGLPGWPPTPALRWLSPTSRNSSVSRSANPEDLTGRQDRCDEKALADYQAVADIGVQNTPPPLTTRLVRCTGFWPEI